MDNSLMNESLIISLRNSKSVECQSLLLQISGTLPKDVRPATVRGTNNVNIATSSKDANQNNPTRFFSLDQNDAVGTERPSVIKFVGKGLSSHNGSFITKMPSHPVLNKSHYAIKKSHQKGKNEGGHSSGPFTDSVDVLLSSEGKYRCSFCFKPFQWYSHWQNHERIHTGERPFRCDICDKAFTRSDGLRCHKLTHVKRKIRQPSQTNTHKMHQEKSFSRQSVPMKEDDTAQLESPNTIVVEGKRSSLQCNSCDRPFFSFNRLNKHMEVHNGEAKKEFKCDDCNMVFSKQSALVIHSRTHTGEKPFRCNSCPKAFTIYGNLKRHLLIHTGERPHTCSKCPSTFNNRSHLTRHMRKKHPQS